MMEKKRLQLKSYVVVTQASYSFCLSSMLELQRCDVRFWFMHPLNLPHMYLTKRFGNFFGAIFKKALLRSYQRRLALLGDSMYFQSGDTREGIEKFYGTRLAKNYTGLLSEARVVEPASAEQISGENIEISWLGRLDNGSKLLLVKKLLTDIECSQHLDQISKFHIIGDGPAKKTIIDLVNERQLSHKVQVHGHIPYAELPDILKRSMIVFAHGTSVYEAVSCRVPVSIVDFYSNEGQVSRMRYNLYSDGSDLTLGFMINDDHDPRIESGRSFDKLLEDVNSPQTIDDIASKQLQKYKEARELGAKNCRILYSKPYDFSYQKQDKWLDTLFFSFRIMLLRMKKRSV